MATVTGTLFGSGRGTENEVDVIDLVALAILPTFAALIFGVISFQISVFGGFDVTQTIWTVAGTNISVALIVTILAAAWILVTNLLNEETDQGQYEYALIVIAILLPIGYAFLPSVQGIVNYHDVTRVAAALWVSIGAAAVAYMG